MKKKIITRFNNNELFIPTYLKNAYLIHGKINWLQLSKNEYFYPQTLVGTMPRVFAGTYEKASKLEGIQDLKTILAEGSQGLRLDVTELLPETWNQIQVSVHMDGCFRIEISELKNNMSSYLTLAKWGKNYGKLCTKYYGDSFIYTDTVNRNTKIHAPKVFMERANVGNNSEFVVSSATRVKKVKGVKIETPVIILSPKETQCDLNQEKINPIHEQPQKAVLCESCFESKDETAAIVQSIAELKEIMKVVTGQLKEYKEKYNTVMEQNTKLQEQLAFKNTQMQKVLKALTAE
jgi:hypothetical protein